MPQRCHRITRGPIWNRIHPTRADDKVQLPILIPVEEVQLAAPAHARHTTARANGFAILKQELPTILHVVVINAPVEVEMIVTIHNGQRHTSADLRQRGTAAPHAMQINAITVQRMRSIKLWLRLAATIEIDQVVARDVSGDDVWQPITIPVDHIRR